MPTLDWVNREQAMRVAYAAPCRTRDCISRIG